MEGGEQRQHRTAALFPLPRENSEITSRLIAGLKTYAGKGERGERVRDVLRARYLSLTRRARVRADEDALSVSPFFRALRLAGDILEIYSR